MEIAHFMTEKSRKRKHKRGKKTVYTYGGKVWTTARAERTIARGRTGYNPPEDAGRHRAVTPASCNKC